VQLSSASSWWQQAVAKQSGELFGHSVLAFKRDRVLWEEVMSALSETTARLARDDRVVAGLKTVAFDLASDDEFGRKLMPAVGRAVAAASKEPQLHQAAVNVAKGTFVAGAADKVLMEDTMAAFRVVAVRAAADHGERFWEAVACLKQAAADAIKDTRVMDDFVTTLSLPVLAALRHKELRDGLVGVMKEGVSEALDDGRFVGHIRDTLCECLQAPHIFRSVAVGAVSSLNPCVRRGRWDADEESKKAAVSAPRLPICS